MARCAALPALALALCCLLAVAPRAAQAQIGCGQVYSLLYPCMVYAQGMGPLTDECCGGVRSLNAAAKTTPDRQATCACLKQAASGVTGLQLGLISGIPRRCHVNIPYAIDPSTDCSGIH